jgi:predicted transcriptional regulator with HTH domain
MSDFQNYERYLGYASIFTESLREFMKENGVEYYSLNIILKKESDESKILQVWNWYIGSDKSAILISQRDIPEGVHQ